MAKKDKSPLSKRGKALLEEFDTAAQVWGWSKDQGTGKQVDRDAAAYDEALKRLTDYIAKLERQVPEIVITMDGGLIQGIGVSGKVGRIGIIDYDVDSNIDPSEVTMIPQGIGEDKEEAFCRFEQPWRKSGRVRELLDAIERDEKPQDAEEPAGDSSEPGHPDNPRSTY